MAQHEFAQAINYGIPSLGILYSLYYLVGGTIINEKSPKIQSLEELEKLVAAEKDRRGIDDLVECTVLKTGAARVISHEDSKYIVGFGPYATQSSVAHELEHIADGWADRIFAGIHRLESEHEKLDQMSYAHKLLTSLTALAIVSEMLMEYFLYREPKAIFAQLKSIYRHD
jgi:hypothetical protein